MKFLSIGFAAILLLSLLTGCDKNDNFLEKQEAFAIVTSGFNGSTNPLEIIVDTATLQSPIDPGYPFKRTDKYTFGEGQDSVKLVIKEKATGVPVYERFVRRGEYSVSIELIYVNGKLISKPLAPANNPAGFRLSCYLFLPIMTGYSGDIDAVYYKKYEVVKNGQLVIVKKDELARMTVKPWQFSEFFKMPSFPGGNQVIDGERYIVNPLILFYKAGTDTPYLEGLGFTTSPYANIPLSYNSVPDILGVTEFGTPGTAYIENYQSVKF
ncbi:hypothetical protein [Paraflavitalea pollutisoli]|uniref:hypothetical protein n=1 Tax=Paraflavitalea pollutisoli TaxID=3034143 RepID=UPI0023EC55CA|nr:hypothetical protein [Paraflavitalea sp. H1-2-19X]